jgi:hypothetical protein
MKKTFLYIKETPLGLKYLGKTTQDPYTYKGSGIYWCNHLKKNNFTINDIKTTILFETTDHNELKEKGLYYSELYDIVNNEKWANLKPEIGDGGSGEMKSDVKKKIKNTMKGKKLIWSEETIKKRNEKLKGRKMPPCSEETKIKIGLANKLWKHKPLTEETKKKISESNKGRIVTNETKTKISIKRKGKKHSEETKKRLSEINKDKIVSETTKIKMSKNKNNVKKVLNTETNIIYNTIKDAANSINMKSTTLCAMLSGQNKNKTKFIYL